VWPTLDPDHAGQVDIWVGYLPASKMGQPRWSLLADHAVTSVFEPVEFGTDQRQRPVTVTLFARNFLIGGMPGSGKSYGARTIATIAAMDPTCELRICEFKGTGDFLDFEPLCSTYAVGVDDSAFATNTWASALGFSSLVKARRRKLMARRSRDEASRR
jgi:S-DNA-T family DNA segregation ATPase FtsK/SpoIIIE